MAIRSEDFGYIQELVRRHSAIVLESGKEYLVEARLGPVARRAGFKSIDEMVAQLRGQPYDGLHEKAIEAMTTNETSFFRDIHPFEGLRKMVIPEFLEKRSIERALNIWCAAASSGQEPYTIAMVLRQHFPMLAGWTVRILATDISNEMVERAREGCFSQLEVNRGLPASLLVKYFQKRGMEWQLKDEIRGMVEFSQVNLAGPWPPLPRMDITFVRNVLIYFDVETKKTILSKVKQVMRPDGYLFLGGAETTFNVDDSFERVPMGSSYCYRLRSR